MAKIIKNYYYIIVPLAITVIMLMQKLTFATIDDCFMMQIANSFRTNSHSEFLVFINVIYGYILKFLNHLIPSVNWFAVLYISIVNIAFIPMYKITQNYSNKMFFVGVLAVLQAVTYYFITFTVMPFICSSAAILWSLEHVKKIDKYSIKHIIFSFVLFCIGFGMRSGSTFMCIFPMFLPIYFFSALKKRNSIWVIIAIMSICFVAHYGVVGARKVYKNNIPEDTYYNQFAEYRSKLTDSPKIDYEKNKEALEAIGITRNDLNMYRSFEYADRNIFSNENMEKMVQMQTFSEKYTFNILEFDIESHCVLVLFAYFSIALLSFIFFKNRRKEIFFFSLFIFVAILYLFIRKRAPMRVVLPITMSGIIMLSYIGMQELTKNIKPDHRLRNAGLILIAIMFVGINAYNVFNINRINATLEEPKKVVEYVRHHQDTIYITDEKANTSFAPQFLSLKSSEKNHTQLCNIFGDWYVYSYFWYDQLDQLGLTEYQDCSFKAVLDERVRVITAEETLLERIHIFLKEHYNLETEYHLEEKITGTSSGSYKFNLVD